MHPRVEQLPAPAPDYHRFLQVLRREIPDRVPMVELAVHPEVVRVLLGEPDSIPGNRRQDLRTMAERNVRAHYRLGYDVVKVSAVIPWAVHRLAGHDASALSLGSEARQWTDEKRGPISNWEDFEAFDWPGPQDIDWEPVETAARHLPSGMALVGFSGGILEFSMDLVGMEALMIATLSNPQFVSAVIDHVGRVVCGVFETYCQMDSVCALWLGDDLGHKHGLLVSPAFLNESIVPWYKRLAKIAHDHGRPFLMHTCGMTESMMPVLIEEVGIDAKHSFEDSIQPVESFMDMWGDRVAVLGGVDVHLLSVGSPAAIRARTLEILEYAAPRGGYACGSGNSIPNYVSAENYLTLIETIAEFNGQG
ncbi:MAG: hypothetical protein JW829_17325 [Pirellulales bacterium]|nr:hypothetical protein [Pirellulales bacterium]